MANLFLTTMCVSLLSIFMILFRENSILFLLLMLGTLWLATTLYNFNQTPYLQVNKYDRVLDKGGQ